MSTNHYKKPFSKELFEANDERAKKAAKKLFKQLKQFKGYHIADNFLNDYKADLCVLKPLPNNVYEMVHMIETEVKKAWTNIAYPERFSDVRIPVRKLKYSDNCSWIMFNADCTACFFIPAEVIKAADFVYVKNRYSEGNDEAFLSINPKDCIHFDLTPPKDLI